MKKNIVKATIVAIVGVIAGINVFNSQNSIELSDVAMANVEALANDETGSILVCHHDRVTECPDGIYE